MKVRLLFALIMMTFISFPEISFSSEEMAAETLAKALAAKSAPYILLGIKEGYKLDDQTSANAMIDGSSKEHNLHLESATEYLIIGIGDNDCKDLDMVLFDENNNIVERDTDIKDPPVIIITPRRTANFSLKVKMASCKASFCTYGILVMKK